MNTLLSLTSAQLIKAAGIKNRIQTLNRELAALLGSESASVTHAAKPGRRKGKMSAAGRARIAAAQKARWAKIKAKKPAAKGKAPARRKKFRMSAAQKAKLAAAAEARWAKVKAAGRTKL